MKIIDLLNKIANNKIYENPNKIKYEEQIWLKQTSGDYVNSENSSKYLFDDYMCFVFETLNDEIEIIEEDKKINTIDCWYSMEEIKKSPELYNIMFTELKDKINELIDEVNKLKEVSNE